MKTTNFALAILCFALPFFAHSQQAAPVETRSLPTADLLSLQKGELEDIKYHNFRFQVAMEEGDQESMQALAAKICRLMAAEIDRAKVKQAVSPLSQTGQQRFDQQTTALNSARKSLEETGKAAQALRAFQDFVRLMEEELAELTAQTN